MTPDDLTEYKRRYALWVAKRRQIDEAVGYTAAPIRVWHFDAVGGEADSGGQRVATDIRTGVRGRR